MQIARILQSQGFGSRRECRSLVRAGRVTVNGNAVDDPFLEFPLDGLVFTVDDEDWEYREKACLMLYKPPAHECTHKPHFYPSIYTLLPPELTARGVQSVGRLDQDTTGLLLLSDDGAFIHRMNSPRRHVPKVYEVTLKHPMDEAQCGRLTAGVRLDDEPRPVRAAAAERVAEHHLRLTLTEGKYHQVKRMVAAVGNRVEALHRSRIGALELTPDLAPGRWRWLTPQDLAALAPVA